MKNFHSLSILGVVFALASCSALQTQNFEEVGGAEGSARVMEKTFPENLEGKTLFSTTANGGIIGFFTVDPYTGIFYSIYDTDKETPRYIPVNLMSSTQALYKKVCSDGFTVYYGFTITEEKLVGAGFDTTYTDSKGFFINDSRNVNFSKTCPTTTMYYTNL
ncbi:MAG: hypothetical protein ACRCTQ_01710 [Brevinemataceae bacterium]